TSLMGSIDPISIVMIVQLQMLFLAVPFAYQTLFEGGAYGQTIGKWAMSISVRLPDGNGPIGRRKAAGRAAIRLVSGMFYLGYLWMLWDREKRTWHDMAVNVRVVKVSQRVPFSALLRAAFRKN
ncbi:MAG: putative RDD family membrane protein YckC, partial [Glaciecola sp.]